MAVDVYTKSQLNFVGEDGATVILDETGKTWTANGNAQIDSEQYYFGNSSGLFDGTGDWVDTPDSSDFALGSVDFTIELIYKPKVLGIIQRLSGQIDSLFNPSYGSFAIYIDPTNNQARGVVFSGSTAYYTPLSDAPISQNWNHIALIRNGNGLYITLNGVFSSATNATGVTINNSAYKLAVGRAGELASEYTNGWINRFILSTGIARWTSNFIPPAAPSKMPSCVVSNEIGVMI